jgi:hypothetical protein
MNRSHANLTLQPLFGSVTPHRLSDGIGSAQDALLAVVVSGYVQRMFHQKGRTLD